MWGEESVDSSNLTYTYINLLAQIKRVAGYQSIVHTPDSGILRLRNSHVDKSVDNDGAEPNLRPGHSEDRPDRQPTQ